MGQSADTLCNSGSVHDSLIQKNFPSLSNIVKNQEAIKYVQDNYPSLRSQAESAFKKAQKTSVQSIKEQQNLAKQSSKSVINDYDHKVRGGLKGFKQQFGASIQSMMGIDKVMQSFDLLAKKAHSQSSSKRQFLLNSLDEQSKRFVKEYSKYSDNCQAFNNLNQKDQKLVYNRVLKKLPEKDLKRQQVQAFEKLKQNLGVGLIERNLSVLEANKESDLLLKKSIQSWNEILQRKLN